MEHERYQSVGRKQSQGMGDNVVTKCSPSLQGTFDPSRRECCRDSELQINQRFIQMCGSRIDRPVGDHLLLREYG